MTSCGLSRDVWHLGTHRAGFVCVNGQLTELRDRYNELNNEKIKLGEQLFKSEEVAYGRQESYSFLLSNKKKEKLEPVPWPSAKTCVRL